MLPYTRWLDWCQIAVLVSEQTARTTMAANPNPNPNPDPDPDPNPNQARTNMAAVLSRLEAIGKQEAAAMRRRLQVPNPHPSPKPEPEPEP